MKLQALLCLVENNTTAIQGFCSKTSLQRQFKVPFDVALQSFAVFHKSQCSEGGRQRRLVRGWGPEVEGFEDWRELDHGEILPEREELVPVGLFERVQLAHQRLQPGVQLGGSVEATLPLPVVL